MLIDDRCYTDNTIHKSTVSCSLQMVLRHVLHWAAIDESAFLRAGSAGHVSIAEYMRLRLNGESPDIARELAVSLFRSEYQPFSEEFVPIAGSPLARLHHDNLALIMDEWFVTKAENLPWYIPDERLIEVGFAYPLDVSGRRVAFGRFDLIGRDKRDGSWVVPDHKTAGRIDATWVESWALDSQLTHYYWAALQHVPNLKGFYVNGIEFSKLPSSDKKCHDHGLPYSQCSRAHMHSEIIGPIERSPELIEHWRADAIRANDKYRFYAEAYDPAKVGPTPDLTNVEMEGPLTNTCRFCSFKDWCRLGQNVKMLPAMFQQDEWMPYDPREFEATESPVAELVSEE